MTDPVEQHEPVASRYEPRWEEGEKEAEVPPQRGGLDPWAFVWVLALLSVVTGFVAVMEHSDATRFAEQRDVERSITEHWREAYRKRWEREDRAAVATPPTSNTGFWQPHAANEYVIAAGSGVGSDYAWAIDEDGKVTLGRGVTVDAASLAFWEAVEKNAPETKCKRDLAAERGRTEHALGLAEKCVATCRAALGVTP